MVQNLLVTNVNFMVSMVKLIIEFLIDLLRHIFGYIICFFGLVFKENDKLLVMLAAFKLLAKYIVKLEIPCIRLSKPTRSEKTSNIIIISAKFCAKP